MFCKSQNIEQFIHIERVVRNIRSDLYIFLYVEIRYEVIELKDIAEMAAPVLCKRGLSHAGELISVYGDAARIAAVYPADYIQKGGFA